MPQDAARAVGLGRTILEYVQTYIPTPLALERIPPECIYMGEKAYRVYAEI